MQMQIMGTSNWMKWNNTYTQWWNMKNLINIATQWINEKISIFLPSSLSISKSFLHPAINCGSFTTANTVLLLLLLPFYSQYLFGYSDYEHEYERNMILWYSKLILIPQIFTHNNILNQKYFKTKYYECCQFHPSNTRTHSHTHKKKSSIKFLNKQCHWYTISYCYKIEQDSTTQKHTHILPIHT